MLFEMLFAFAGSFAALLAYTFLAQSSWLRKSIAVVARRIRDNDLQ